LASSDAIEKVVFICFSERDAAVYRSVVENLVLQ